MDKILQYGKLGEALKDDMMLWSNNDLKGNRKGKSNYILVVLILLFL